MERKRVSGLIHLYCAPLFGDRGDPFLWGADVAARNAIGLRQQTLRAAVLGPIDYAREGSLLHLIPEVVVSSRGSSGTVTLHFRKDLRRISSIAVDPSSSSEIVLARLILAEQFDVMPVILPTPGECEEGLQKADAVLLVGDASLRAMRTDMRVLDLVEEWNAMTGLPYVHGFWCSREHALVPDEVEALQEARRAGVARLEQIAMEAVERRSLGGLTVQEVQTYLEGHSYQFGEEEEAAVGEFLQFAFYHGILPDVPDLRFIGNDDTDSEDPVDDPVPPTVR